MAIPSHRSLGLLLVAAAVLIAGLPSSYGQAQFPDFGNFGGGQFGGPGGGADLVQVSAEFTAPEGDRPAMLFVTAELAEGYHVYAIDQGELPDGGGGPGATQIRIESPEALEVTEDFRAIEPPKVHIDEKIWEGLAIREHYGTVTWYAPLNLPADVDLKTLEITGTIDTQACDEDSCVPMELAFTAVLGQGKSLPETSAETQQIVAELAEDLGQEHSVWTILGWGVLGGLILNLMPCVLPVIGLKVLSFAKQGGESRARILGLNLAYVAGLLSVFMLLATLAALVKLGVSDQSFGWGELYTLTWFKVGMTGLVFAMALSFLGVWELPIPGFATTGKATELAAKEGPSGAFFMGVFTTILATPCSGPFLGPVFGYTINQPPSMIYLIFLSVGIGMGLPYLAIGLVPALVGWLPKPGAWMETFKNLMGFVLLGTVVYLFSTIHSDYFIATLTLVVGIWFACWCIGQLKPAASFSERFQGWVAGWGVAVLAGLVAFTWLVPSDSVLPWQPYSADTLQAARAEGKTVMVDFTADWCLTCKTNLKLAINQEEVKELVEENDVVPLLADWTDRNDQIKDALARHNSVSIPLMAIYPADPDREPIVLRDLLTKQEVLDALQDAGPSRDEPETTPVSTVGQAAAVASPVR